jgi:hypothetical protein
LRIIGAIAAARNRPGSLGPSLLEHFYLCSCFAFNDLAFSPFFGFSQFCLGFLSRRVRKCVPWARLPLKGLRIAAQTAIRWKT